MFFSCYFQGLEHDRLFAYALKKRCLTAECGTNNEKIGITIYHI